MRKLMVPQRGCLVVAGAYRDREEADRTRVNAGEQRGQFFILDEVGSEKIGAEEQNSNAAAVQNPRDVAPPIGAVLDISVRPDFEVCPDIRLQEDQKAI